MTVYLEIFRTQLLESVHVHAVLGTGEFTSVIPGRQERIIQFGGQGTPHGYLTRAGFSAQDDEVFHGQIRQRQAGPSR